MKTLLKYLASSALLILLFAAPSFAQQYTLTQTTLSADLPPNVTSFGLASVTNVTGVVTSNNTDLYIDRELMQVVSVNATAKTVTVLRGVSGTQAAEHRSGQMVLAGAPAAFQNFDPEGGCSTTAPKSPPEAVPAQPTINTRTSAMWLCSSVTKTWVPGFGNPGISGTLISVTAAVAVSSTAAWTPTGPLFHVTASGSPTIGTITIPVGFNATAVGGGGFCVIPDDIFSTTASSTNIALGSTAVVNKLLCFTWDATNSKFVPSY